CDPACSAPQGDPVTVRWPVGERACKSSSSTCLVDLGTSGAYSTTYGSSQDFFNQDSGGIVTVVMVTCTPDCSCAANLCSTQSCGNGCGGSCQGQLNCCTPNGSCSVPTPPSG